MENKSFQEKIQVHRRKETFQQEIEQILREGRHMDKSIKQIIAELTKAFLPYTDDLNEENTPG